jgi:uncharacterized membrane protein
MKTRISLFGLAVFALGLMVTLLSGLYGRNMSQNIGVERIGYGYPLGWHGHSQIALIMPVIYWFDWEALMLDVAFWSLVFTLLVAVFYIILKLKRSM